MLPHHRHRCLSHSFIQLLFWMQTQTRRHRMQSILLASFSSQAQVFSLSSHFVSLSICICAALLVYGHMLLFFYTFLFCLWTENAFESPSAGERTLHTRVYTVYLYFEKYLLLRTRREQRNACVCCLCTNMSVSSVQTCRILSLLHTAFWHSIDRFGCFVVVLPSRRYSEHAIDLLHIREYSPFVSTIIACFSGTVLPLCPP